MSPSDALGRELLTPESERALARQAAVAALTAVGQMRTAAEAEARSRTNVQPAGSGVGVRSGSGAGNGTLSTSGEGASGAVVSGASAGAQASAGRKGRAVGFASPERAIRRPVRGSWAARG